MKKTMICWILELVENKSSINLSSLDKMIVLIEDESWEKF